MEGEILGCPCRLKNAKQIMRKFRENNAKITADPNNIVKEENIHGPGDRGG